MNAADRLDEIQARADKATALVRQYVETGGEAYEVIVADRIFQAARTDVPALVAALRGVLHLHRAMPPLSNPDPTPVCFTCDDDAPCSTFKAVTEALGEA